MKAARLASKDEANLRWYLSGDAAGDVGVRSNFPSIVRRLELRAMLRPPPEPKDPRVPPRQYLEVKSEDLPTLTNPDDTHLLKAADRLRRVDHRWQQVGRAHRAVLRGFYGPRGEDRPDGLRAFVSVWSDDELGGVVLALPATRRAHQRSGSPRSQLEWLRRVSERRLGQTWPEGKPCGDGGRHQRRADERLVEELVALAQAALVDAVAAFYATRELPEIHRPKERDRAA